MKWSNAALAVVTSCCIGLVAYTYAPLLNSVPTAVISVKSDSAGGGGFSMNLPSTLSKRQSELLSMAYDIAKKDGHAQPQVLQGILMQETKAGDYHTYKVAGQEFGLRTNERYYGVAQIKLAATRDVLGKFPALKKEFNFHTNTDEEVIAKLIENDKFNITIASKYLLVLKAQGYDTIKELALAYNQGAAGAKKHDANTFHYSTSVMKYIQQLKHSPK